MSNENGAAAAPNPGLVFEMLQGHQGSAALKPAYDCDGMRLISDQCG
jgi:hypothetical protein